MASTQPYLALQRYHDLQSQFQNLWASPRSEICWIPEDCSCSLDQTASVCAHACVWDIWCLGSCCCRLLGPWRNKAWAYQEVQQKMMGMKTGLGMGWQGVFYEKTSGHRLRADALWNTEARVPSCIQYPWAGGRKWIFKEVNKLIKAISFCSLAASRTLCQDKQHWLQETGRITRVVEPSRGAQLGRLRPLLPAPYLGIGVLLWLFYDWCLEAYQSPACLHGWNTNWSQCTHTRGCSSWVGVRVSQALCFFEEASEK